MCVSVSLHVYGCAYMSACVCKCISECMHVVSDGYVTCVVCAHMSAYMCLCVCVCLVPLMSSDSSCHIKHGCGAACVHLLS